MSEKKVQSDLIEYLKGRGCWTIKLKPGFGVPTGAPDVLALGDNWWGVFECKASKNASFRPLQKETIEMLDEKCFARVVYPENYDDIIAELEDLRFS